MKLLLLAKIFGVAVVAKTILGAAGGVSIARFIGQAYGPDGLRTSWAGKALGLSSSATIGESGCMLTSFTLAYNIFSGEDWNPDDVQDVLLGVGGCFVGELLELERAAAALSMSAPDGVRIHPRTGATPAMLRSRIRDTLSRGGVALVNVDASAAGAGQHFILVHKEQGGFFMAADPAVAKDTPLNAESLKGIAMWGSSPRTYNIVGVAPIFRG